MVSKSIIKNFVIIVFTLIFFSCNNARQTKNNKLDITKKKSTRIDVNELTEAKLFSGKIERIASFPSKYIKTRPVDVWLPKKYSNDKQYAVLYMHDGQMLFDASTTWNKQEWKVDEVATNLMENGITKDFIVVAIHNISEIRWLDLFPEKAIKNIPEKVKDSIKSLGVSNFKEEDLNGDEYLKFLVEELKPFIDRTYAVYTDRNNTYVAGSSMGGLMSMYAISEYPEIFGGAACISTHWVGASPEKFNPLPKAILKYVAEHVPDEKNHKLYFDYGNKTLDQFYPQYAPQVDSIYLNNGYSEKNFINRFFPDTNHSENSWQTRLHIPLTFLFKKEY